MADNLSAGLDQLDKRWERALRHEQHCAKLEKYGPVIIELGIMNEFRKMICGAPFQNNSLKCPLQILSLVVIWLFCS
jgi:hypothetical protein